MDTYHKKYAQYLDEQKKNGERFVLTHEGQPGCHVRTRIWLRVCGISGISFWMTCTFLITKNKPFMEVTLIYKHCKMVAFLVWSKSTRQWLRSASICCFFRTTDLFFPKTQKLPKDESCKRVQQLCCQRLRNLCLSYGILRLC